MVVIPHIQLVVSGVVIYGGDVLVRVWEWYLNGKLLPTTGIVGINHHVAAGSAICLPLIILEDRAHGVEHAAGHEGVASSTFVKASCPGTLKAQSVGVHLQTGKT